MIIEIVSAAIIISACLAIFLDEAVYAVAALAGTFLFTSLLYALNGAPYAAIFQVAVGIGTVTILFLSGETLSEKNPTKTPQVRLIVLGVLGAMLSLPAIFLSISTQNSVTYSVPFGEALWDLRAFDLVLQGLVIMTVALGIAIVLYHKKRSRNKRSVDQ
jgi:NADH:ubiquinone oxidoreductase subunit 6 (subunit J)